MNQTIAIQKNQNLKGKPDDRNLSFGKIFTDHMFIMDYHVDQGWYDPRIIPYGPLSMDPSTCVLHYGQGIFEGLKAYRTPQDNIQLFRPHKNIERMNDSCERMCIPTLDVEFAVNAIRRLVEIDRDWVPRKDGTTLYIRPFIIATDEYLGVHPSHTYKFIIILSPSGAYYPGGINPVKIYVESRFARSVIGGTGAVKTMGNYACGLKAQEHAEKQGYVQVLWLDGIHKKYIEEVGAMNVFFKIDDDIITPKLQGSILPGITRDSVITLLKSRQICVREERITINDLMAASRQGRLKEAFGTGTAAVISPIGEFFYNGETYTINGNNIGPISKMLYDTLTDIQFGRKPDCFGWIHEV